MAKNKFRGTDVNLNLKSRDELENTLTNSLNVIELQERQIEVLKKGRIYERKFMLYCYAIMTAICVAFQTLVIIKGYNFKVVEYLAIFISSVATSFCIIKLNSLFKRFFMNEDTIDHKQIKSDVALIRNVATEDLKFKMAEALESQDYETAAKIRDEINKRA